MPSVSHRPYAALCRNRYCPARGVYHRQIRTIAFDQPRITRCVDTRFLTGTVIAVYHSGVEFGVFQGPTDCTGAIEKPVAIQDFLKQLETVKVVRCDEVAMRIFGLSLASWNAVICAGLTLLAAIGMASKRA